jgi:hypothetical protein
MGQILPGVWKSRGIDDLDLHSLPLKVGCQLQKTEGRGPHPKPWKEPMGRINQKDLHKISILDFQLPI